MKLNVKLLRQVREAILKYPRQFNMDTWFCNRDSTGEEANRCGTAACIAGWTVALSDKKNLKEASKDGSPAAERAERLLRLDWIAGAELFYQNDWPAQYDKAYDKAKTAAGKAKVAAARIDAFIRKYRKP